MTNPDPHDHHHRLRVLAAIYELLRAVRCDRSAAPEQLGVNECLERGLLDLERTDFPPLPRLTPEGIQMLVHLVDTFEAHS